MPTTKQKTEWRRVKLGTCLDRIIGGGTPSKSNPNFWNGSIPWASVKDMSDNNYRIYKTQDYISEIGLKNSASNLIKSGSIIISTRMGLGRVVKNNVDMAINQDLKALVPNEKIYNIFLLYCYIANSQTIKNLGTGSTVSGVKLEDIKNLEINLPNLQTQKRIADVLSAYDDLIENNNKRIKILESMAQKLYVEWFVYFKFLGHEKVKMVDSGTEFGVVPEGWEVKKIGDIIESVKRKLKLQVSEFLKEGKYAIIDQGKQDIAGYTDDKKTTYSESLILFGDHTRCFKYCNFEFACGADGTQLLKSKDFNKVSQILLYFLAKNAELENNHYARHFKFLKELYILVPLENINRQFSEVVEFFYSEIRELKIRNINLIKSRDLLIPQLVSGQILINE